MNKKMHISESHGGYDRSITPNYKKMIAIINHGFPVISPNPKPGKPGVQY